MITFGMSYEVLHGREADFKRAVESVMNVLSKQDGHTHTFLFHDCHNKNNFLIMSEWSNEDAFEKFIHSPAFRKVANWGADNILSKPPVHRTYR